MQQAGGGSSGARRWLWLCLKITVTVLAFAYLLSRQSLAELSSQLAAISPLAVASAVSIQLFGIVVGAVRWQLLLRAYGATALPPLTELTRVYLIGFFYNTYLPGGIGGDVVRGVVTREAFSENGTTRAMAVVLVERALGLAGMLALTILAAAAFVRGRFDAYLPLLALGFCGVCAGVVALALARRFATFAPGPLRRLLEGLPMLAQYRAFAIAAAMSLLTHVIVALSGHVLVASVHPTARVLDSLVAMPLAAAAGYFPLTVAGAGAREYVLVELYMGFGVPKAAATATAIAFFCAVLTTGAIGGLVQLLSPLKVRSREPE